MRIIADTATLFSPAEGAGLGMTIVPVCVIINNRTYKDYVEISCEELLRLVADGGIPSSSQPAVGDILDIFESSEEEMLVITIGDGLSGGYQTALSARNCVEDCARIHVVNSKTLAGPLRYLAKKAVLCKEQGMQIEEIKAELTTSIESSVSFVLPEDFEFLKRSGRLTSVTAKVGGVLKLLPVLTQTEDKTRIKPVAIKRTWKSAVDTIVQKMKAIGVNEEYLISVCHADSDQKAVSVMEQIKASFPFSEIEILQLSPGLITHGGPGCIVVQAIKK